MNNITFKKITDLEEAEKIWDLLSYKKTIYDSWEFRYAYTKLLEYPLAFYTMFDNDEPVSLLPLEFNLRKNYLQFFGGNYTEDNMIYTKKDYEEFEERLIAEVTERYLLEYMEKPYSKSELIDNIYILPLADLKDKSDYIDKYWSGKSKQKLKAQMRKLEEQNLIVKYNEYSDLKAMARMNIDRFGDESTFNFPNRLEHLTELINNFDALMISIYINNKLESVGLSVKYKDFYYGFNSGTNGEHNGLGKYLILEKIDQAIKSGAKFYSARAGNLGWKEAFGLTKKPQYSLSNIHE